MNRILYVGKHARTLAVSQHYHNSWELIFCTSGSGKLIFDGRTLPYSANEIAVIPPLLPHSNVSAAGFTNIHINLAGATLSQTEPTVIPADCNGFLLNAFTAAFYFYSSSFEGRTALLNLYGQLIASIIALYQPKQKHSEIVQQIADHILANYSDSGYDVSLYLNRLPFSAEYLKKLFKKEIGLTPHQFLTDKRLDSAANILINFFGKVNISEVARLCGFSDPLYFSRLFKKKYGVPPRDYTSDSIPPAGGGPDSMKLIP